MLDLFLEPNESSRNDVTICEDRAFRTAAVVDDFVSVACDTLTLCLGPIACAAMATILPADAASDVTTPSSSATVRVHVVQIPSEDETNNIAALCLQPELVQDAYLYDLCEQILRKTNPTRVVVFGSYPASLYLGDPSDCDLRYVLGNASSLPPINAKCAEFSSPNFLTGVAGAMMTLTQTILPLPCVVFISLSHNLSAIDAALRFGPVIRSLFKPERSVTREAILQLGILDSGSDQPLNLFI
uniref:Uncharacterized protein n=1 Tax=Spongospora subterranea TaxID=70186 RepID=A0A0H5R9I7_9EUKA|eukprot:CRZ10342.1 hypothetical protein [Spongospora subterranea]